MKKLLFKYRYLLIIIFIPYLFIVSSSIIKVDYDITSIGYLNPVRDVIKINNKQNEKGSFNTVSVLVNDKATLLKYLIAKLDKRFDVTPTSTIVNTTSIENSKAGIYQKLVSINNSLISAFTKLQIDGYSVKMDYQYRGILIHTLYVKHADGLMVGDIIQKINDEDFSSVNEFNHIFKSIGEYDSFNLSIIRNQKEINLTTKRILFENMYIMGIAVYDYYTINQESVEPRYELADASTEGPSGGFLQALSVYNSISNTDLTKGLKIAGTGTIDVYGNIGEIGGIYQKIITAYYNNADIFLVPVTSYDELGIPNNDNYRDALKAYNDLGNPERMKLVPVNNLNETINYLTSFNNEGNYYE